MVDFDFGGEALSSFGYIPACINNDASDSIQMGSSLTLNTVKINGGTNWGLINTAYDEVLTATFDICKNPCDVDDLTIYEWEMRNLMTWLLRKDYQVFKPKYDDGAFSDVYFRGTFTSAEAIYKGNAGCIGLSLTFTADAPWGFFEQRTKSFSEVNSFTVISGEMTDEIGFLYPSKIVIEILESGNLTIHNSLDDDDRSTVINNVTSGEIITMNCESKTIKTNKSSHSKFYNDFNYNFPRIIRNYDKTKCTNVFSLSLNCNVTLDCVPIRKVGVLP